MTNFERFLFSGLNPEEMEDEEGEFSGIYLNRRFSEDLGKVAVSAPKNRFVKSKYGYIFILNSTSVLFLKEWQGRGFDSISADKCDLVLTREYFIPRTYGNWKAFDDDPCLLRWGTWLRIAKRQQNEREGLLWLA